jgi:hypothetical protein
MKIIYESSDAPLCQRMLALRDCNAADMAKYGHFIGEDILGDAAAHVYDMGCIYPYHAVGVITNTADERQSVWEFWVWEDEILSWHLDEEGAPVVERGAPEGSRRLYWSSHVGGFRFNLATRPAWPGFNGAALT